MKKENIIDIITDEDGRKIVVITDIRFKGKRRPIPAAASAERNPD